MKPFNRRRDDDGERKEDIRHLMMSDVRVVQKPSSSYRVSRSRQNNNSSKCTMGQSIRKVGILLCFLFIGYDYSIVRNGNEGSHDSPPLRTSAGANSNNDDDVETTTSKLVITGSSHLQTNTNSNNNSLGSTTTTEKLAATPNVKSISQTTTTPQKGDSSSLRKGDSSSIQPAATVVADTKSNNVEKLATPNANELETSSATPNVKLINPTTQPKPEKGNDTSSSPPPSAGVNTKNNNNNMETTTTTQSNKNNIKNQAMSSKSIELATTTPSNNVKPISSSSSSTILQQHIRHVQIKPFPFNSNFCFIHISKCAGASWIELLQKQLSPNIFYPKHSHGEEYSLYYSQQTYDRSKEESLLQMLISFKSPRRHLWSLFTECKYDDWGRRQINGTNFPNIGNGKHSDNPSHISTKTDDDDFIYWMKHFFDQKSIPTTELSNATSTPSERYYIPIRTDSFRCYHPANYQSRHLVSKMKVPHVTSRQDVEAVPPLRDVLEKYQTQLSWTALTEFFHESKCLFYWRYRKNQAQDNNNNNEMVSYIHNHCTCKDDNAPTHTETIVKHHDMEGNREHFYHMPPRTLEMMDALTTVDRILYQEALFDFIANIIEMENDLKHTVLCNYATEKYENELKYILSSSSKEIPTNNITELVHLMRRERQNQQQQQQQ